MKPNYVLRISHLDYIAQMRKEDQRYKAVRHQVLQNCAEILDMYKQFVFEEFVNSSNIVNNLTYGKVEAIKQVLHKCVDIGLYLYIRVALVQSLTIPYIPNQDTQKIYNTVTDDDESRQEMRNRYDTEPIISNYETNIFNEFIENSPEFFNYPFRETNLIRLYIDITITNTYLMCLSMCSPDDYSEDLIRAKLKELLEESENDS